jgi:glyoxylase-like metal-dependent hydrolase (beta-lactamase superfamily II)
LVDARFPCEIAEDVWVIPDRRTFLVPNIGIVVGKEAALVIDCGLGPGCGEDVVKAAERVAPGRKLILTQTHAHPEHAFGAVAFKNRAQIFLNRQQNDYLVRIGPTMLQLFRERYGEQVRQILDVQARVKKMAGSEGIEPLISKLKPELMAAYPTWEHDRFIEPAIRYFAS